jgi:hypothetical protein
MNQARTALVWIVRLFLVALVVQFFFAGAAAFGAESWDLHSAFGLVLVGASLVILVVAALARQWLRWAGILVVAMLLQMVLAQLDDQSAWIASLHAVNALVVLGVAGRMAGHARGRVTPA